MSVQDWGCGGWSLPFRLGLHGKRVDLSKDQCRWPVTGHQGRGTGQWHTCRPGRGFGDSVLSPSNTEARGDSPLARSLPPSLPRPEGPGMPLACLNSSQPGGGGTAGAGTEGGGAEGERQSQELLGCCPGSLGGLPKFCQAVPLGQQYL